MGISFEPDSQQRNSAGLKRRSEYSTREGGMDSPAESSPLMGNDPQISATEQSSEAQDDRWSGWIFLAIASGACASFNGVFAKLTTTALTSSFSRGISDALGLPAFESVIEYIVRAIFFGLNLAFNGIMWALFTKALARGHSTTQVQVMNTSSNFFITAILGFAIFSESLPPLWWLGAALLVAGNVIIGRKKEGHSLDRGSEAIALDSATATPISSATLDPVQDTHDFEVADSPSGTSATKRTDPGTKDSD
ncbi:hypothetical protein VTK73DRAFT_8369 [Phialemonium thermophilum]|uniref:EamA domain-containing protein n=1 Tax=Phialemonium thermophilum TaxID=223376 RepID=A0ABR3XQN2_9PEZI